MTQIAREPENADSRKPWIRPTLTIHGDARVLTMYQHGIGKGGDGVGRGPLSGGGPAHS